MQKATLATYIWVDADGSTRSKVKVLKNEVRSVHDLPVWNFDGSSTGQALGKYSDVLLKPQRLYVDPFRGGHHVIVLCDCWDEAETPNACNSRNKLEKALRNGKIEKTAVKLSQQYILFERATNTPIAWKTYKDVGYRDNSYYCGTGGPRAFGQRIVEQHAQLCIEAGVDLLAYSAEKMPGMWRFELDIMETMKAFDDWIVAKYIMCLLSEKFKVYASYDCKPYYGESVGPQLNIELPYAIKTQSLPAELIQSFEKVDAKGKTEKLALKEGCEIVYAVQVRSRSTSSKFARERLSKPAINSDKRSCTKKTERTVRNGADGYALMADVVRVVVD